MAKTSTDAEGSSNLGMSALTQTLSAAPVPSIALSTFVADVILSDSDGLAKAVIALEPAGQSVDK